MKITGVASSFPKNYYSQQDLTRELAAFWGPRLTNPKILERLYKNEGVEGRHLALPVSAYLELTTWGKANSAWIECAQELGESAICRALTRAGITSSDLEALFVVSVTGIASPSLDALLMNRMHLNQNLNRVPIFGLGCVAGAAGIARAADYVRAYPSRLACLLSVELCSLTWQRDDLSMANLISAGLFGDGAAAVIVAGADAGLQGPEILATRSVFYPNSEHVMGWDISEKGFRVVLSPEVPLMVEKHLRHDVDAFLSSNGLTRADIASWILHPGGPKVLQATAAALELPDDALAISWDCLRRVGNLSSASVLLVLEEVMIHQRPSPGTYSLLAAMGPGFCSELVLLRW